MRATVALVEHPGGMPDREPRPVDVHGVVGQHERHALVLAQRLAEKPLLETLNERVSPAFA
jgi:hypothetical protein